MADIVGAIALSHSPFWDLGVPAADAPGRSFAESVIALRPRIAALDADAVVLFGPDHLRNFFYDMLPAWCIGVEQLTAIGDYGRRGGSFPVASRLARDLFAKVSGSGFDPAISYRMGMDHGMSQPCELLFPADSPPLVPVMINANTSARPSLSRCHAFGQAVGAAIRQSDAAQRVLLIASGGMSHWVQSILPDDPKLEPSLREYAINGRAEARAYSARRDASLAERIRAGVVGKVNEPWDRWVLAQFADSDCAALCACSDQEIEGAAGNGAHELRAWVAALGAWGRPLPTLAYEAVPRWVTGMGCVAAPAALHP